MKLIIITAVKGFQNDILRLFKQANIKSFSSSHIDALFSLIKEFNTNLETNNPIKTVVVPIEKFI